MNKYFLHINEPCSQDWDSMTAAGQGKFCSQCSKTVIDFTGLSDAEIIRYIESRKEEKICGNFYRDQLGRWVNETELQRSNPAVYKIILGAMLMMASQNINAQTTKQKAIVVVENKIDSTVFYDYEFQAPVCNDTVSQITIPHIPEQKTRIILRGGMSSVRHDNNPLVVLDGVTAPLSSLKELNPDRIKAINILQGASAAALYGPDAVNGVIIVTTTLTKKEGKKILR